MIKTTAQARADAFLARLRMLNPDAPGTSHVIAAIGVCGDMALRRWMASSSRHPDMADASPLIRAMDLIAGCSQAAQELAASYSPKRSFFAGLSRRSRAANIDSIKKARGMLDVLRLAIGRTSDASTTIKTIAISVLEEIQRDAETLATLHAILREADIDPRIANEASRECISRASELANFAATVAQARAAAGMTAATCLQAIATVDLTITAIDTLLPTLDRPEDGKLALDRFVETLDQRFNPPETIDNEPLEASLVQASKILRTQAGNPQ